MTSNKIAFKGFKKNSPRLDIITVTKRAIILRFVSSQKR